MSQDFIWQGQPLDTVGKLSDAMSKIHAISDQTERERTAGDFMTKYRAYSDHADANIGYLCGYFDHDTMVELLTLFGTKHPLLGRPKEAGGVTPAQAFMLGQKMGSHER